jgi:hypothetical protein
MDEQGLLMQSMEDGIGSPGYVEVPGYHMAHVVVALVVSMLGDYVPEGRYGVFKAIHRSLQSIMFHLPILVKALLLLGGSRIVTIRVFRFVIRIGCGGDLPSGLCPR